jgi:phage repressor protein C with HTH and peptisase S24 domain
VNAPSGPRVGPGGAIPLDGEALAGLMRAVLEKGKPFRFEARGASMHPVIRDGDIVTVRPFAGARPGTGDVVAFVHPLTRGVLVHRVVRADGTGYVLKGDNALAEDGAVAADDVLGRVARIERDGRIMRPGRALHSPALARLSRSSWFTRLARRLRRALGRPDRRA